MSDERSDQSRRVFSNHLSGVNKAMTGSLSNQMAERLNGKIQLLKSIGRGYQKFDNFRSAILFLLRETYFVSIKMPVEPLFLTQRRRERKDFR